MSTDTRSSKLYNKRGFTVWYSPPSTSSLISRVSIGQVSGNVDNTGFTAAIMSINNSGLTANLSFTVTTDNNGTQVKCGDVIDTNSMTCTIMISGMSLTVSYITNMYYHYKVLQVMLLQDWILQLSQTLQSLFTLRSEKPVIIYLFQLSLWSIQLSQSSQ